MNRETVKMQPGDLDTYIKFDLLVKPRLNIQRNSSLQCFILRFEWRITRVTGEENSFEPDPAEDLPLHIKIRPRKSGSTRISGNETQVGLMHMWVIYVGRQM